jgi:hypothetical protein
MKEILISLSKKNTHNRYLKNKLEIRCKCGYFQEITYFDLLTTGEFNIGQPVATISPFISESIYDETINVTPLHFSIKCPVCDEEISVVFPLSLENLISMLQSQPPDPLMYG